MELVIGDKDAIELRNKGRVEAWLKEFQDKLRDKVSQNECPPHCEGASRFNECDGPDVIELFHKGIVWACSNRNSTCECCGQDMDIDIPNTDFEGKSIGWVSSENRKPFDPSLINC